MFKHHVNAISFFFAYQEHRKKLHNNVKEGTHGDMVLITM